MDGPRRAASAVGRGVGEEVHQRPRAPEGYAAHDAWARPLPGSEALCVQVPPGLPPVQRQHAQHRALQDHPRYHSRDARARARGAPEHHGQQGPGGRPGAWRATPAGSARRTTLRSGCTRGFRAPKANERARAFGMGRYLADLGLTEKELFDATKNKFDKDALLVRVGCPIRRWVSGEPVPMRSAPTPAQVGIEYEALCGSSTAAGARPRFAPVPADMPELLREMEDGTSGKTPGTLARTRCRRGLRTHTGAGGVRTAGTGPPRRGPVRGRGPGRPGAMGRTSDTTSPVPWA